MTWVPVKRRLTLVQGASFHKVYVFSQGDVPLDFTGYTARAQIREAYGSESALLDLTTENGGIVITPTEGKIELLATPEQTSAVPEPSGAGHVWDLELEASGGTVYKPFYGSVDVIQEATR